MRALSVVVLLLAACVGERAPDRDVCEDVVAKLCASCDAVRTRLDAAPGTCFQTVRARTRCDQLDFAFTAPTRERVLDCRLPLIRAGTSLESVPACEDALEALQTCPDLELFLLGRKP